MAMTVEGLSRRTGVAGNTIRYYTRIGLLRPSRHPSNGYRLFGVPDLRRLVFIRKARWLGLSLSDIQRLIRIAEEGGSACAVARAIVANRLVEVRQEIAALEALHGELEAALRAWQTVPDTPPSDRSICPLIESVVPDRSVGRRRVESPGTRGVPLVVPT